MQKLYIASPFTSQSFPIRRFKRPFRILGKISAILFCVTILSLKAPPASGMTPPAPVHPVNVHNNFLRANSVHYGSGPAGENFDEVTLTGGTSPGFSPRTIGDWTFSLVDNTGANDLGAYQDVTNDAASTHLANGGTDKALEMTGALNVATTAVIKPSGGAAFSLISFDIENGYASSPDYRVVGYVGG
ncbi:MAG TPA: hypothetical protein VFX43_17305, partial [Chitinophagaceae bacterium]|nr:hypothetical protein [Chitinophagaceae bacterium]